MAPLLETATAISHQNSGTASEQINGAEEIGTRVKAEDHAKAEDTVVFTSYDGTVREVSGLPPNLGRATALASERSVSKVWGTPEEDAACHAMREEI